jgi:predicted RNA-binding Zn-ribbon protein involved in translation (DUF1610 family)
VKAEYAQKVSYLKGLFDGMELDKDSKEGKILLGVVGALEEISKALEALSDAQRDLEEYVGSIDDDLADLESLYYEEDDYFEVECPKCGEAICVDPDFIDEEDTLELVCPNCGEIICYDDECMFPEDEDEGALSAVSGVETENLKEEKRKETGSKCKASTSQTAAESLSSKSEKDAKKTGRGTSGSKTCKDKKKS